MTKPRPGSDALAELRAEVGHRLKTVRKALGLTQDELGEHLGCSRNHIWNYESGTNFMPPERMVLLHQRDRISPNYLLLGLDHDLPEDMAKRVREVRSGHNYKPVRQRAADV